MLVTKCHDLSSIPGMLMVERTGPRALSSDLHILRLSGMHALPPQHVSIN